MNMPSNTGEAIEQTLMSGVEVDIPLVSDEDTYHLSIYDIQRTEAGELRGKVTLVDEYATTYEEDIVTLPERVSLVQGEQVLSDEVDTDESKKGWLRSSKIAAAIGGTAVIAGSVAVVYWAHKHKKHS